MPSPGMYRGDQRRREGLPLTTTSRAAPPVDGIDDWMLLSEPPGGG